MYVTSTCEATTLVTNLRKSSLDKNSSGFSKYVLSFYYSSQDAVINPYNADFFNDNLGGQSFFFNLNSS